MGYCLTFKNHYLKLTRLYGPSPCPKWSW